VTGRTAAVVLAAGRATRFGDVKMLAPLTGRPLLQHVLDAAASAGLAEIVVVLGDDADEVERAIAWRAERRVRNPAPARGLSSSVRIGLAALPPDADAALLLLGDQPLVRPDVISRLVRAAAATDRAIVVPRYPGSGAINPVLLGRVAWGLADGLQGDRGLGPLIAAHPELVLEVPVDGDNPDVDTPADLAELSRPTADLAALSRPTADRPPADRVGDTDDDV
jgi:CTP:molybdopterin cytidylyltransferase MocA